MAEKKKILVLLDAHAILHRAFHALPPFSSPQGEPTGALYGYAAFLLKVIRELEPDYLAAAYDLPQPTFRHAAYEKYKGQREEVASDLQIQIRRSYDILKAFSIPVFENPNFEADDILGTLVEKTRKVKKLEVIIASGDLDTLQLVEGKRVRVYTLRKGLQDTVLYDEDKVKERFGFGPKLLPDFKGLKGDPSDNILGVPGIGDKTATELIQKLGTLSDIFKTLKKDRKLLLKAGIKERTVKLLEEHEEEALFSKTLAEIRRDAPINFSLEKLSWLKEYSKERASLILKELGFTSFLSRLPRQAGLPDRISTGLPDRTAADAKEVGSSPKASLDFLKKEKESWWYFSEEDKKLYAAAGQEKISSFDPKSDRGLILEIFEFPGARHFFDAKKIFHVLSLSEKLPVPASDLKIYAWLSRPHLQNPGFYEVFHNFLQDEFLEEGNIAGALKLFPKLGAKLAGEISEKKLH